MSTKFHKTTRCIKNRNGFGSDMRKATERRERCIILSTQVDVFKINNFFFDVSPKIVYFLNFLLFLRPPYGFVCTDTNAFQTYSEGRPLFTRRTLKSRPSIFSALFLATFSVWLTKSELCQPTQILTVGISYEM